MQLFVTGYKVLFSVVLNFLKNYAGESESDLQTLCLRKFLLKFDLHAQVSDF